jgi:hypothetical protein
MKYFSLISQLIDVLGAATPGRLLRNLWADLVQDKVLAYNSITNTFLSAIRHIIHIISLR